MHLKQIIGLICLVIGIYLIYNANRAMDTTAEKFKQEFTGDYSKHARNNMVGGIVLVILGGGLLLLRGKK